MNQEQNELIPLDVQAHKSFDDEIDLLGYIQALGEEKWLLLGLPFFCTCIATVISFYLAPIYSTKSTFVVHDKQSTSTSAVLDQLGGLAGSPSKNSTEMYIAFMQSNTVQDVIISELDLTQHYQTKTQEDTRKKLLSRVKIAADKKSGLITIEAQDQSPDIAVKLANAYLKPLRVILNRMFLEDAHQRRDFFAQQIAVIAQRPFRDPFVQSALMSSMIKQYEAARIDEARESQILFAIDVAQKPERESSPKRILIVLIVGMATFFLTIAWILIKKSLLQYQSDLASAQKWAMMKKAWKLFS